MKSKKTERLMSGNEALARGALEASIGFCASYPGTPSTEITASLHNLADEHDIYVEWSVNEKVALEAAAGASWAGIPSISAMKSLGMNVSSDFLLNLNLSGSGEGGLVIIVCDDPRGHSSSNEQDSRFYAKAAQLPLLEPSTYQEAKDIIPYAVAVSKEFQIPVIVRSTTRLSHSSGLVRIGKIPERNWSPSLPKKSYYNVPNPHQKHRDLLESMKRISDRFSTSKWNKVPTHESFDHLIITSGICHQYSKEAVHLLDVEEVGILNLVTTYPLPRDLIEKVLIKTKNVLFSEEVDPFIEDEVIALMANSEHQPRFFGKRTEIIPAYGEMTTDIMKEALAGLLNLRIVNERREYPEFLVNRPLTFCAGCTHRNFYWAIRKVRNRLAGKLFLAGDIGCYSLGVFYDMAMNSMQAMGSGIGVACGLGQLKRFDLEGKIVSVAGDSTFFHACIPGLVNARHKNADLTFVILDNATTAMTGFQIHPGSKVQENNLHRVQIEDIVKAIQPDYFEKGDAGNIPELVDLLHSTITKKGLKVLLLDSICRLEETKREVPSKDAYITIDHAICRGEKCRICVNEFGCPAINWNNERGKPVILDNLCIHCGACVDICPHGAIKEVIIE
ncbi:indolepyruvate ferredoxin oxidoreductase [Candidatus Thorarchaeota archaeon]|nr:MAG: indolepyruvate ferredoxin oxidoreductase [Candidatus Thorarchaeota archaeon]